MKRILAALLLAFCGMALHAQATFTPSAMTAMCFSSTLAKWVPVAALASGTAATYTPQSVALYGNNGASYYPLQCDASGDLITTTLTYWTPQAISTGNTFTITQNKETYTAYDIPNAVVSNAVCLRPTTADNTATNNYSFALYNSSGAKVLDTGAIHGSTFASSVGVVCMALSTTGTIPAGRYYASFTTNCSASCAVLGGIAAYAAPLAQNQGATTAGGAANATITPPADSYGTTGNAPWWELHK